MRKITTIYIIILLTVSIWGIRSLIHRGFYSSHDGWHQVARLYHFDKVIREGQFPPKWVGSIMHGAGYPLFMFNYHMPWFMAEPLIWLGMNYFDAIKTIFILGYILSGLIMFFWIKDMYGEHAGFLSAFLYIIAPYRFSNIYVRASLGEATCYIFMPLFFWAVYKLKDKNRLIWIVIGAIGIAGLILSHAMIMVPYLVVFLFYWIYLLEYSLKKKLFIFQTALTIITGFTFCAYYLLPVYFFRSYTAFNDTFNSFYKIHFVPLQNLIYSPWGYGFSHIDNSGMSLQLGIIQWLVLLLSAFILPISIYRLAKKQKILLAGFLFFITISTIFLMTPTSIRFWQVINPLSLLDYPWRLLTITLFCISILGGILIHLLNSLNLKYLGIALFVFIGLYTNRNYVKVNMYMDRDLQEIIASEKSTNSFAEYRPRYSTVIYLENQPRSFIVQSSIPDLKAILLTNKASEKKFSYEASTSGEVLMNILSFPGWKAFIDGKPLTLKLEPDLISTQLPEGNHAVTIFYDGGLPVRAGNFISLASLLSVFLVLVFIGYKKMQDHIRVLHT